MSVEYLADVTTTVRSRTTPIRIHFSPINCINRRAQHAALVSIIHSLSVVFSPSFFIRRVLCLSYKITSVRYRRSFPLPRFPLSSHLLAIAFLRIPHFTRKASDIDQAKMFSSPRRRGETLYIRRICMPKPGTADSLQHSRYSPKQNQCGLCLPNLSPRTARRKLAKSRLTCSLH